MGTALEVDPSNLIWLRFLAQFELKQEGAVLRCHQQTQICMTTTFFKSWEKTGRRPHVRPKPHVPAPSQGFIQLEVWGGVIGPQKSSENNCRQFVALMGCEFANFGVMPGLFARSGAKKFATLAKLVFSTACKVAAVEKKNQIHGFRPIPNKWRHNGPR